MGRKKEEFTAQNFSIEKAAAVMGKGLKLNVAEARFLIEYLKVIVEDEEADTQSIRDQFETEGVGYQVQNLLDQWGYFYIHPVAFSSLSGQRELQDLLPKELKKLNIYLSDFEVAKIRNIRRKQIQLARREDS